MALGLTQASLDHFAGRMMALLPTVELLYRDSGLATARSLPLVGHWIEYSQQEKAAEPGLRNLKRLRLPRTALSTKPARGAILRQPESGETWEIKSTEGGPGRAFWFLQCQETR